MAQDARKLEDLRSIGKETLEDFRVLGITSVAELSKQDPNKLYGSLCKTSGVIHDICVLDTFTCAVAQAKNSKLPEEQKNWWYYSRIRKSGRQR